MSEPEWAVVVPLEIDGASKLVVAGYDDDMGKLLFKLRCPYVRWSKHSVFFGMIVLDGSHD